MRLALATPAAATVDLRKALRFIGVARMSHEHGHGKEQCQCAAWKQRAGHAVLHSPSLATPTVVSILRRQRLLMTPDSSHSHESADCCASKPKAAPVEPSCRQAQHDP